MSHNKGTFEERLAFGKEKEAAVMEELQRQFWSVIPATDEQDKADKIDCWVRWKGVSFSVAIKYRESGRDLGIALIRPWTDLPTFQNQYPDQTFPYDRDYQHIADLYAVGTADSIDIVTGHSVVVACQNALVGLAESGQMRGDGYELKVVTDKGTTGYSSGHKKLIIYLSIDNLERIDV